MGEIMSSGIIERNIAMELVRVTETAAMAAARYLGRGDKTFGHLPRVVELHPD